MMRLSLRRRRYPRLQAAKTKVLTRRWTTRRSTQGIFPNLISEVGCKDPERFHQFHYLDRHNFEEILARVEPFICKEATVIRFSHHVCVTLLRMLYITEFVSKMLTTAHTVSKTACEAKNAKTDRKRNK